jgi:hypothetical protein
VSAAPYLPADDAQVLERLPRREGEDWDAIAALRTRLKAVPRDVSAASELARRYLELFRAQGDPRLVAYAQRALAPWADEADAPAAIALRRAELAQSEHRFDAARAELERVVAREPRDGEAWLTLAAIDLVRADYGSSRRECGRLVLISDTSVTGACLAAVQAMTGEARRAYEFLDAQVAGAHSALPLELAVWLETLAAETGDALDRADEAAHHYRAALAAAGARPSVYLLAAYADHLLRVGDNDAVVALLRDAPPADSLDLRLALAQKRAGRDVATLVERLGYRLRLGLDGLESTHAREAAYFALYLLERPELALERSLANWEVQREPIDARLVLESAAAAGRPEAARAVLEWLDENRVEHAELQGLRARF